MLRLLYGKGILFLSSFYLIYISMRIVKAILLFVMTALAITASASKAHSLPRTVTLNTGREVTVRFVGDENVHFYVTDDGEVVLREDGVYRLASFWEQEEIRTQIDDNDIMQRAKSMGISLMAADSGEGIYANNPFPHVGQPKCLLIMAAYADTDFTFSKDAVDSLFNARQYNTKAYTSYGSVAQYFDDCSGGAFRPQFDVVGPYVLDREQTYYGGGSSDRDDSLLVHACRKALADGVDFSQYDSDNNGYIDAIYVLHAGYGAVYGHDEYIYPKTHNATNLYKHTFGGKKIQRYSVSSELFGDQDVQTGLKLSEPVLNGIGVVVHEFSHLLGLPDFYPTTKWLTSAGNYDVLKYDNQSMEDWDIMDNGENSHYGFAPTPYSAWERELMGWTDKMDTLTSRCDVTLTPLLYGGAGKRIMNDEDSSGREFYILENIPSGKGTGWYTYMPGSGMVVTHINYNKSYFSNFTFPNNVQGSPRITILPADGQLYSSYRAQLSKTDALYMSTSRLRTEMKGDPYPYISDDTAVDSLTEYKAYNGTVNKPITNITRLDDGTVTFKFMGGSYLLGDVNRDGEVTMADANAVANYCAGNVPAVFDEDAARVTGNDTITVRDAQAIVKMYLGK